MLLCGGTTMSSRGRPPKENGSGDTKAKMVRLSNDLAGMISWIVKLEGGTASQLLDPLIRGPIQARYAKIKPQVEKIKRAQEEARQNGG